VNEDEWLEVKTLADEGVSQREIAARLGINRRRVARMLAAGRPLPARADTRRGSQLDRLAGAMEQALTEQPDIKAPQLTELLRTAHGYAGSVDLVRRHLAKLRAARPWPTAPPGPRAGEVLEWAWVQMPTRPLIRGVRRSVWALVVALPYSGAHSAYFSFDPTLESFMEGHVRIFAWLGGVPRACVYHRPRELFAKRDKRGSLRWNRRFRELRRHYGFESRLYVPVTGGAEGEGLDGELSGNGRPTVGEGLAVEEGLAVDGVETVGEGLAVDGMETNGRKPDGELREDGRPSDEVRPSDYGRPSKNGTPQKRPQNGHVRVESAIARIEHAFWPKLRFKELAELDAIYAAWRDNELGINGTHSKDASSDHRVEVLERLHEERAALRPLPEGTFDFSMRRTVRVPPGGYVRHGASFYRAPADYVNKHIDLHASRDEVWMARGGRRIASYARSYQPGSSVPPQE
jgi:transposase